MNAAEQSEAGHAFAATPNLPDGCVVHLPGRGDTFVYDVAATLPGAPTLVLLHGWTVTAALNFHEALLPLAEKTGARVIGMDQRGHGRGIKPRALFRLDDCADDVGALIDVLALERVIVVGYSMGGAVAQLTAKRHPGKVMGAIFCATTCYFGQEKKSAQTKVWDVVMPAVATGLTLMPPSARQAVLGRFLMIRRGESVPEWMKSEIRNSDPAMLTQAGIVIGRFDARPWLKDLTLPAAVVKTLRDQTVLPRRQQVLIDNLPNVTVHECDADHRAAVSSAPLFVKTLSAAVASVQRRAR